MKKYLAEMIGTMVLVLMGCGAAVSLSCTPAGIGVPGVVGTALAFGLAVVAMAYAIGGISGCHINPAVSLGVLINGGMEVKDFFNKASQMLIDARETEPLLRNAMKYAKTKLK